MASHMSVGVGTFYDTVYSIVKDNVDTNSKQLKKDIDKAANKSRDMLRSYKGRYVRGRLRPVGASTGVYAAGWEVYRHGSELSEGHYKAVVANKAKPQLTHLVEDGHVKYIFGSGPHGRVAAHKHIEPAYEAGASLLGGLTVDNP